MRCSQFSLGVVVAALAGGLVAGEPFQSETWAADAPRSIDFNRDIRPLLSNTCYQCHGPDAAHREAGLRLDQSDSSRSALASGKSAIVPGQPEASELFRRITSNDPDHVMPPPKLNKPLSAEQIELLRRWIAEGAEYQGHWAFRTPVRHEPPTVTHQEAVQNPIDQFLQAQLEKEGLTANPEADKVTLIRRLTLDLTGLPPTPAEVDAFLSDEGADAYSRLVDRLLESPRFGEHFGRIWLDAARYGDTHGLHLDNERSMWPYRDWVIRAFNENKPFDVFTIEQLAGDLLPQPTIDQRVATGFNRCNVTTSEGGSIDAEVLVRYAADRTETLGTVWMGLTLNCCMCHDHKFDPISQKEFYSLYSFYYSLADRAMDGNALLPPPTLKLPSPEQSSQMADLDQQLAATQTSIRTALASVVYDDPALKDEPVDALSVVRQEVVWFDDELPSGARQEGNTPWEFVTAENGVVYSGARAHTRTAEGTSQHFFTGATPPLSVAHGDRLFAYCYIDPANPPQTIMLQFNDGSWEHRVYWGADTIAFGSGDVPGHRHGGPVPPAGKWVRLEVDPAHVGLANPANINGWAFTQTGGKVTWDRAGLITVPDQKQQSQRSLLAWQAAQRPNPDKALPGHIQNALKVAPDQQTDEQRQQLREHFLQYICLDTRSTFDPLNAKVAELTKQRTDLDNLIPATLVSEDLPTPRQATVLIRGAYDKPGDPVERGVPHALAAFPEGAPLNRLGLAQWLVAPNHPLTARVIVNRYWQHYFGTGIVKTAEDFGAQGAWPTHPELLDWLATEFVRTGWNVKQMQKLLVMSAAYRRSSHATSDLLHHDPENLLLARGPRFRLDAEVIRDNALAVSGLLVERSGGKSVKPYQPEGLWESISFVGSNTREFKLDAGTSLYRRSLYTFWKRTSPPPTMLTFDAPSRENCTVRRSRTNTPLQSLALMNDEQFVEASRHLAQRMLLEGGPSADERLVHGFRLVTARRPSDAELSVLREVLNRQLQLFSGDTPGAEKLLQVGASPRAAELPASEHAAYTLVANLLLNLDEAITKE
jgi:hypothetical protein